jgi:hypothetical protein
MFTMYNMMESPHATKRKQEYESFATADEVFPSGEFISV